MRSLKRILSNGALVLAVLLALALLGELGLRVSDMVRGQGFFNDRRDQLARFRATPLAPFRLFGPPLYQGDGGTLTIKSTNNRLFPLHKPAGDFRVVCFGGSTTHQGYPRLLEAELRRRLSDQKIEVINVGFSGYSTPHSLIELELDVISWQPDLVIISHNINDLLAAYFPDFRPDYSNKYRFGFFSVTDYKDIFTPWRVLLQNFQLYWWFEYRLERLELRLHRDELRSTVHRRSYGMRPPAWPARVFKRNLESFIALARMHGFKVVLATQPLEPSEEYFMRHYAHKPYNDIVVYPLHAEFVAHHHFYNGIIRQVASERGAGLVDNAAVMNGRTEYFIDSVHYSKAGMKRLTQSFADTLIAKGLVP